MNGGKTRETWRDWCAPNGFGAPGRPDPRLITRDELLATLARWGVKTARGRAVEESTLRHWVAEKFIPTATIEGEQGNQQALYASWVADLILLLRRYQDDGMKPAQLRTWLRGEAHRLSRIPEWRAFDTPRVAPQPPGEPMPLPREYSPELIPPLARMMHRHSTERGIRFVRAELHLVTTSGEALVYTVERRPLGAPLDEGVQ